jgi:hypothetical protein
MAITKEKVTLSDGKVVEIREPLVRDLRAIDNIKGEKEKEVRLVGSLTNMTIEELDAMPFKEYSKLLQVVGGFFS